MVERDGDTLDWCAWIQGCVVCLLLASFSSSEKWVELCPPEVYMLKFQPPGPQKVTVFGDRIFAEITLSHDSSEEIRTQTYP